MTDEVGFNYNVLTAWVRAHTITRSPKNRHSFLSTNWRFFLRCEFLRIDYGKTVKIKAPTTPPARGPNIGTQA